VIQKKLRQIDALKEQQASGKTLDKDQSDKLQGEKKLREELKAMESKK
jgi:uncharacterized protein with WD repeat